ncbi:MAG TPA: PTS sugar transporter subunit IIB [Gemmatimonadaceae bacterium]|nr:PTS sugar transporter subunit IIB [Gemmatimonadaceae bacterium]
MGIELFRIDDRLIHGQVVVGWGRPLNVGFIALVDDEVADSDWEQELYRMGVPPEIEVYFATVQAAAGALERWRADPRPGIVLTGDVDTMRRLIDAALGIAAVNLGGVHHRADRVQRLRYVYLSSEEERTLRALAARGIRITAQDVPAARPVPLEDVLVMRGES